MGKFGTTFEQGGCEDAEASRGREDQRSFCSSNEIVDYSNAVSLLGKLGAKTMISDPLFAERPLQEEVENLKRVSVRYSLLISTAFSLRRFSDDNRTCPRIKMLVAVAEMVSVVGAMAAVDSFSRGITDLVAKLPSRNRNCADANEVVAVRECVRNGNALLEMFDVMSTSVHSISGAIDKTEIPDADGLGALLLCLSVAMHLDSRGGCHPSVWNYPSPVSDEIFFYVEGVRSMLDEKGLYASGSWKGDIIESAVSLWPLGSDVASRGAPEAPTQIADRIRKSTNLTLRRTILDVLGATGALGCTSHIGPREEA